MKTWPRVDDTFPNANEEVPIEVSPIERSSMRSYELFPRKHVVVPLEYFIKDFILQMYPEAIGHINTITGNVMKTLEKMIPVEYGQRSKRSKGVNIDEKRAGYYDWNLVTLNDLVTKNKLRLK